MGQMLDFYFQTVFGLGRKAAGGKTNSLRGLIQMAAAASLKSEDEMMEVEKRRSAFR